MRPSYLCNGNCYNWKDGIGIKMASWQPYWSEEFVMFWKQQVNFIEISSWYIDLSITYVLVILMKIFDYYRAV